MKNRIIISLIAIFLLLGIAASSQSILNKRIDIDVENASIEDAFRVIEQQAGFFFAYNADYIDTESRLTIKRTGEPVKSVLDDVLRKQFKYLPVGDHVVLSPKTKSNEKSEVLLSGFITDTDAHPLDSVIVYVVDEERVTLTKRDGSYSIQFKPSKESICINVSHPSFEDTILHIRPGNQTVNIQLYRKSYPRDTALLPTIIAKEFKSIRMDSSCQDLALVKLFVPQQAVYIANEINTVRLMPVQLSLIPGVGSNALVNGLRTNIISLNMLAGYAQGVRGLEFGGLVNVIQKDVIGGQFAGLANVVNGKTSGLQASGLFNYNFGRIYGLQAGGLANITRDSIAGAQLGGLFNFSRGSVTGLQAAGLVNVSGKHIYGCQMAGFANVNTKPLYGLQLGGIANNSNDVTGAQMSGLYNYARNSTGGQVAGLVNIVRDTLTGVQISGLINRTKVLRGIQVGVVNLIDTIECGIPIGLFNFVRHGYRAFELSYSESFPIDFFYKTGGKHLYTLLNIGADNNEIAVGYGLGIHNRISRNTAVNFELLNSSFLSTAGEKNRGSRYSARLGLELEILKYFALTAGVSVNHFIPEDNYNSPYRNELPFSANSNSMIDSAIQSGERVSWFGWFFGIRI